MPLQPWTLWPVPPEVDTQRAERIFVSTNGLTQNRILAVPQGWVYLPLVVNFSMFNDATGDATIMLVQLIDGDGLDIWEWRSQTVIDASQGLNAGLDVWQVHNSVSTAGLPAGVSIERDVLLNVVMLPGWSLSCAPFGRLLAHTSITGSATVVRMPYGGGNQPAEPLPLPLV